MRRCLGEDCEPFPATGLMPALGPEPGLPALAHLSPAIVPLREFPLRKWYYADPHWYYHAPALQHRLATGPDFYKLVDPLLRELCRLLHGAGLMTTPSCQGHFYLGGRFEQIWETLQRDAAEIRSAAGLLVRDSETHEPARFHDPQFALPWPDGPSFVAEVQVGQRNGYLGIALPPEQPALLEQLCSRPLAVEFVTAGIDPELARALGQPIFAITVTPPGIAERDAAWRRITEYFAGLLTAPQR